MAGDRQSAVERKRLAERRRRALYLTAVRGLTIAEVAQVTGVGERTAARDLKAARERAMAELQAPAETAEMITPLALDIDAALNAVAREAWASVTACEPAHPQRVRALNLVLMAVWRRAEVLQSLGLLKKEPDKVQLGFDSLGLSDEELQQEIRGLRDQAQRGGAAPEGADPADAADAAGEPAAGD
jgi:hypothetical protein